MPPATLTPRFTKTRWTLTAISLVLLALWIVNGWRTVWYVCGSSIVGLNGGNIVLVLAPAPDGRLQSRIEWKTKWPWPEWKPSLVLRLVNGRRFSFTCPLFLPALVLGVAAAWRRYRRARPVDRPQRLDRTRQLRLLRWIATTFAALLVGVAIANNWVRASYTGPRLRVSIGYGEFNSSLSQYSTSRPSYVQRFKVEPSQPIQSVPPSAEPFVLGGHAFTVAFTRGLCWNVRASLWFLAASAASGAGLLWFVRPHYRPRGQCPHCRYDLTGLAANAPCPECGRSVRIAPPA